MWELFSLFALTASRLEGELILPGISVIHSRTWRILYPSVWPWADMGHPPPCSQPGSEVWVEQCLVPCQGEAHPRGAEAVRDTPGTSWQMVSPHLPPHGPSFLRVLCLHCQPWAWSSALLPAVDLQPGLGFFTAVCWSHNKLPLPPAFPEQSLSCTDPVSINDAKKCISVGWTGPHLLCS